LGLIPEADLMELRRPRGEWTTTADPEIVISGSRATITCETDSASIAYRVGRPPSGRWLLHTGPIALKPGETIEAMACRLGFKDSQTVSAAAK
jgi:hypothetical protein